MATTTLKKRLGSLRHHRVRLEARAFELSKSCPANGCLNPVDCPLFNLRPLSPRERRAWIRELSDDELDYLTTYHACCQTVNKTVGEVRTAGRI